MLNVEAIVRALQDSDTVEGAMDVVRVALASSRGDEFPLLGRILDTLDADVACSSPGRLISTWAEERGRSRVESFLASWWPDATWRARRNLGYAAADPRALTTEGVLALFDHPASGVDDRHLFAAGLATSAKARGIDDGTMIDVLGRIGNPSSSPNRQRSLDSFRASAFRHFSGDRSLPGGPEA